MRSGPRCLVAVALAGAVFACGRVSGPERSAEARPFEWTSRVGWLHGDCLALADSTLAPGTAVTVVAFDDVQSLVTARIDRPTTSGDDCWPLLEGRGATNLEGGATFYRVDVPEGVSLGLGIGVVDAPPTLAATDGVVRGDLDGDGRPEAFTQCATAEGVRFEVWSGEPFTGTREWNGYYYLDYDQEADCPD